MVPRVRQEAVAVAVVAQEVLHLIRAAQAEVAAAVAVAVALVAPVATAAAVASVCL
jgi:hypothetical protein